MEWTLVRPMSATDSSIAAKESGRPFGFNIIGSVAGNSGLSVSARNIVQLLLDKGYPVAIYDVDPGWERKGHDVRFEAYTVDTFESLPYSINIFCMDILAGPRFVLGYRPFQGAEILFRQGQLNVAMIYWELNVIPPLWALPLELFDVAMVTSHFIRSTLERHLSNVLTLYTPLPLYQPKGVQPCRARFGLPDDATIFLVSFDPLSDPRRKNPIGAIEAFQRATDGDPGARLVIKANISRHNLERHPHVVAMAKELRTLQRSDPRVHLMLESLSYSDVLSLYASCDVFVSLHRAEGLGLGPMEAMALGKPVIATGWSGNMTFMTHTNSCLVRYRLVEADGAMSIYQAKRIGRQAQWAEPDIDDAAAWMRRLLRDPELRATIGRRAAEDVALYQTEAEEGRFIEELRAVKEHRAHSPANADARALVRRKLERAYKQARWKPFRGVRTLVARRVKYLRYHLARVLPSRT